MASLYIVRGPDPGRRIELDREVTIIGRSLTCDVPVPSVSVSRQHCRIVRQGERFYIEDMRQDFRIVRQGERFYIEDMKSVGGTFVNDQRIQGATQLTHGDRI